MWGAGESRDEGLRGLGREMNLLRECLDGMPGLTVEQRRLLLDNAARGLR